MKNNLLTIIALSLLMNFSLAAKAWSEDLSLGVQKFNVGQFTVFALLDRESQMKADLFSGPLSSEEKEAYMPGGQAPSSVNIFLIQGPSGNILIDAGWGDAGPGANHFPERLELLNLKVEDIDAVILTHMHPDHIGGLLKGYDPVFPKARIAVARPELEFCLKQPGSEAKNGQAPPAPPTGEWPGIVARVYADRLTAFDFGQEPVLGLTALEAVGHTPGHTVFRLRSGDEELLLVGDIIHAAALQFPQPDECASFDQNRPQAVASRKKILNMVATEKVRLAGAHIPFPGVGTVTADNQNGFAFSPWPGTKAD